MNIWEILRDLLEAVRADHRATETLIADQRHDRATLLTIRDDVAAIKAILIKKPEETVTGISHITVQQTPPAALAAIKETHAMSGNLPTAALGTIQTNQTVSWLLNGTLPAGDTFVEPVVTDGLTGTQAGTVVQEASSTAPTDGSAPVSPIPSGYTGPFTTPISYNNPNFTGTVTLTDSVGAVPNYTETLIIVPTPPEAVTGISNVVITLTENQAQLAAVKKAAGHIAAAKVNTLVGGGAHT